MAKLTSSEIKNASFDRARFNGYNSEQVDKILDSAAETLDTVSKENAILNEKVRTLSVQLEELKSHEFALNGIMLRAQKLADEIVAEAQQKSDAILTEARNITEKRIALYKEETRTEEKKLIDAKALIASFVDTMCDELNQKMNELAQIKSRVKPDDEQAKLPDAPPSTIPAPAPVQEAVNTVPEAAPSFVIDPAVFAPKPTEAKAPDIAVKSSMANEIAGNIFGASATTPVSSGKSWDEIIGIKNTPAAAPSPASKKADSENTVPLKFGKEFDITIQ